MAVLLGRLFAQLHPTLFAVIIVCTLLSACTGQHNTRSQSKISKPVATKKLPVNRVYDKICYYSGIELLNFAELYKINPKLNKAFFKVYQAKLNSSPSILRIYRKAYLELRTQANVDPQEFGIKYYLICTNYKNFYTHNRVQRCFRLTNIQRLSYIARLYGKSKNQVIHEYMSKTGSLSKRDYRGLSAMIDTVYKTKNAKDAYNVMYTTFKVCRDNTEVLLSAY